MEVSDFYRFFYPAVQAWLRGVSPYSVEGAYNPPWAWWVLGPVAAWPHSEAWWMWTVMAVAVFLGALLLIRRPHGLVLVALGLAPATLVHLSMGQWVFWLLLGVALLESRKPSVQGVGLLLLALKPHLGWPFLLATRPRAWPIPIGALLLSLLLDPRWPLNFVNGIRATPPIEYDGMLAARSLGFGTPFLVGLAIVAIGVAGWAWMRLEPERRWQLALLCSVALIITPYQRLYDNVLLYYPIMVLTEKRSWAWGPLVALLWLPVGVLGLNPRAVWVDWLLPLVVLVGLVAALAHERGLGTRRLQTSFQQ